MKRLLLTAVMAIGMVATRAQYDIIPMPQRISMDAKGTVLNIEGQPQVTERLNKDIASLKGYKKVDPSTFFKEVPPSMKEMFEEMSGYAKTENGATVDRLVVIDGCALTLLHIEGEIEDKDLRLVMNIM